MGSRDKDELSEKVNTPWIRLMIIKRQVNLIHVNLNVRDTTMNQASSLSIQFNIHESYYLQLVNINGRALCLIPKEERTSNLCYAAVKRSGMALRFVPKELRTPEMYNEAVKQNCWALKYVPEDKRTPEMYLEAVKQDGRVLRLISEKEYTDKILLAAAYQLSFRN